MIDSYQLHSTMEELHKQLESFEDTLNIENLREEYQKLSQETERADFWDDQESAQSHLKEMNLLKEKIDDYDRLVDSVDDLDVMIELVDEGEEFDDLESTLESVKKQMKLFRIQTLFTGEYDKSNAIIAFHPGSGGTESNDWAEMLLRMYTRWAEGRGFKVKTLDLQPGGVAGIKSATLLIEGTNAYGYLKTERGVHRLVRISPFDSSGRRHTSFASLDVTPEVDETINIEINPDDIRVDTYRASGAGGQHVNKTSSAIRITHMPTGIVVQCQNERSQHQNREVAMNMLRSKLVQIMEDEHKEKLDEIKGDYGQITWGNQIRSYVFQPYTMVKDHRTKVENGNISSVMDGNLDDFINASLLKAAGEKN